VSTLVLSSDGGYANQPPVVQPHDDLFDTSVLEGSGGTYLVKYYLAAWLLYWACNPLTFIELILRSLTFHVRESMSPLSFLSLYDPFPSASTTSYGPSHFGPAFCFLGAVCFIAAVDKVFWPEDSEAILHRFQLDLLPHILAKASLSQPGSWLQCRSKVQSARYSINGVIQRYYSSPQWQVTHLSSLDCNSLQAFIGADHDKSGKNRVTFLRNWDGICLRLPNFSVEVLTLLSVILGDYSFITTSACSGHALIPLVKKSTHILQIPYASVPNGFESLCDSALPHDFQTSTTLDGHSMLGVVVGDGVCHTKFIRALGEAPLEGYHQLGDVAIELFDQIRLRMRSLASFFLRFGSSADLLELALLLSFACLHRGATSSPSRECMLLFLSPNRVKTFQSLWPSLVNTVLLIGLLRRVSSFCRTILTLKIRFLKVYPPGGTQDCRQVRFWDVVVLGPTDGANLLVQKWCSRVMGEQRAYNEDYKFVPKRSRVAICRGVARDCARITFLAKLGSSCSLRPCADYAPCGAAGVGPFLGPPECWAWANCLFYGPGLRPR
ncbi:hypothetical protein Tco_0982912, partial [Tanacetum coccineum]